MYMAASYLVISNEACAIYHASIDRWHKIYCKTTILIRGNWNASPKPL